jgi:hypothetical protein
VRYPGRHYRRVYGYPLKWAVLAELGWRLEHAPLSDEGQPLERLAANAYGWRKAAERRGSPLLRGDV